MVFITAGLAACAKDNPVQAIRATRHTVHMRSIFFIVHLAFPKKKPGNKAKNEIKRPLKDKLHLQGPNRGNFDAMESLHSHTSF